MTAAKVMDIISRLPGCAGQAADAVSAYTLVKMEYAPKLLKIPNSECPDIWIRLPRHKWPKSWSSMEDPVVPLEWNLYGHPLAGLLWEKQFEKVLLKHGWEKIPNWECLFVHREKGLFLSTYVDDIKIGWKETKHWSDVESTQQWSRFGRTNIFPWSCILGMHSKTMWNKQRYCGQLQSHVWIANFSGRKRKTTKLGKTEYFYVVLRYGRSCQEMCGTVLWVSKQNYSTTLQSINSMSWWPSIQRRIGIRRRIVQSMLSNCLEMSVYSMVSQQICTCDYKVGQSMRQTFSTFDLLHSFHKWVQTVVSCGKYCTTMQIGTVSRLWFCGRSWRLEIDFSWDIMHIRRSHICSNKLDLQETNMCITQFNRVWNYFS